jgi:CelD/BcsL family acetyltransferase involved in cellulose biosynthesis
VNPIDPLGKVLDRFVTIPDTTEILSLRDFADEDSLRAHFHHSARKQINKGCRAGLTARVSEQWEEWEEYYRIYEARLRNWGKAATSRYPMALLRALYEARGSKMSLWVVARDGKIVGGNLNFYQGRHCVEWHAAYDPTFFSCGARDFLVDRIIRNAWGRGFTWYDFNPSAGIEGTRRFKRTFGTGALPSNLILWRRGIYRLESTRRALRTVRGLVHRETGRRGADSSAPLPN